MQNKNKKNKNETDDNNIQERTTKQKPKKNLFKITMTEYNTDVATYRMLWQRQGTSNGQTDGRTLFYFLFKKRKGYKLFLGEPQEAIRK